VVLADFLATLISIVDRENMIKIVWSGVIDYGWIVRHGTTEVLLVREVVVVEVEG
jgi:hypothetical protein